MEYAIGLTVVILKVLVGLGFVIFVHELGHFTVAKLCGVKCEKFYIGFDIAGLKLCKFRWGETEYGIGIFPLGGYVKMLGQEDNPAKLREEMERAKEKAEGEGGKAEGDDLTFSRAPKGSAEAEPVGGGQPAVERGERREARGEGAHLPPSALRPPPSSTEQSTIENQRPLYDPRSFLAKSVPKRMAIISAGVIMNLIFAFLMAVVAFRIGTEQQPAVVSDLLAGYPAWSGDALRPGDEILAIAGTKIERYLDVLTTVTLDDINDKNGVSLLVRRPGVEKPLTIKVYRGTLVGSFKIGVSNPRGTRLVRDEKTWLIRRRHAVMPLSAAALATPAFCNGDRIVEIDGKAIGNYGQIAAASARQIDRKIAVTVERKEKDAGGSSGATRRVTISVEPQPLRELGLVMGMGEITAVQANSPAAAVDIQPGDKLRDPDGPSGDPMTLPDRLLRQAGKTVKIEVERGKETKTFSVRLREPEFVATSRFINAPVEVAALGVTYRVLNRVDRVAAGSPADKAGMKPGDMLVKAKLAPPGKEDLKAIGIGPMDDLADIGVDEIDFDAADCNWPLTLDMLQSSIPGSTVELTYHRGDEDRTTEKMTPVDSATLHSRDRGFCFEPLMERNKAHSLGEALALGGKETLDQVTLAFRTVKAIGTSKVSMRKLVGPWGIIKVALHVADAGYAELLLFLTLLSANLAVLNFLPIPILDGGLFVLLGYEGIRGKPASETTQTILAYIGLAIIIALMVWVFGLDLGWIARQ